MLAYFCVCVSVHILVFIMWTPSGGLSWISRFVPSKILCKICMWHFFSDTIHRPQGEIICYHGLYMHLFQTSTYTQSHNMALYTDEKLLQGLYLRRPDTTWEPKETECSKNKAPGSVPEQVALRRWHLTKKELAVWSPGTELSRQEETVNAKLLRWEWIWNSWKIEQCLVAGYSVGMEKWQRWVGPAGSGWGLRSLTAEKMDFSAILKPPES